MANTFQASSLVWGLIIFFLAQWTAAEVSYCSPDNNSGGSKYITSIYMSNGKCTDNCRGSYVFAVVQGVNCYCSNDVPGDQVSVSSCSTPCPGYPSELCGNPDRRLYGYIDLGGTPSGTSGGDGSSSSTSPVSTIPVITGSSTFVSRPAFPSGSSSTHVTPEVSMLTSTVISQSSAEPSSTSVVSSSDSESVSASPSSLTDSPTQVYTSVISITGTVSTIIITPTASASDSALGQSSNGSGGGLTGGKVAGIVVGAALGIGLIVGLGVFIWLRRRHKRSIDAMSEGGSYTSPSNASKHGNNGMPSRQVSQLSSAGLLTKIPRIHTGGFSLHDDIRSAGTSTSNHDRNSTHVTVDQRLNPWAIYSNEESRTSNVSLQDNQDYSRQLRVANPDP